MTVVAGILIPFQQSSLQQAPADVRSTGPRWELQEDRYSQWKVAFDRARPTEISRQEHAGSQDERYTGGGGIRDEESTVAIDDREPVDRLHSAVALSTRMSVGAQTHGAGVEVVSSTTAAKIAAPAFSHVDVIVAPRAHALPPAERSQVQASAATSVFKVESDLQHAPRQPPADSVSVFLKDGSVQIVVRDAGIRDDQALHAAFVTARELTGRRDSLRELTVNGRTVYRQHQPDTHQHGTQQQTPSLTFAC